MQLGENVPFCPCCGFVKQDEPVKLCTSIYDLNNIGVSTYLYFETVKHLTILLIIGFFVYSIFAIVTNVISTNKYRESIEGSDVKEEERSYIGILVISNGSKPLHHTDEDRRFFTIQCILGIVVVIIWGLLFILIKYR